MIIPDVLENKTRYMNILRSDIMGSQILIIDDSSTVRDQVSSTLMSNGFETIEAIDGEEGLACLKQNANIKMVLCDVNMPKMNGLDMMERVQKDPTISQIPVIMLTTEADPKLIKQAKSYGAKGWMVKPFKPDLLVQTAQKLLH